MKNFQKQLQNQFDLMCQTGMLFTSSITGQQAWDTYLTAFPTKEVFRDPESSVHECNNCKNFMRRYGNIVGIVDGKITSIWDAENIPAEYKPSANAVKELLRSGKIQDVFIETFEELNSLPYERTTKSQPKFLLGVDQNRKIYSKEEAAKYGGVEAGTVYTFDHLHLHIPKHFIRMGSASAAAVRSDFRSKFDVFKRCMSEVAEETFVLMKDLIVQGSLLDSNKYVDLLNIYIAFKKNYESSENKDNYCWTATYEMTEAGAKFGNSLQGQFLKEVSEGKALASACTEYNKRIDPANYMKARAPITEAQRKIAEKFVVENGYMESFNRRLATLEDIKASEILHINRGDSKSKSVSIFDKVQTTTKSRHKRSEFDKVETVSIETFMKDILPSASAIEVLLESKHRGNLVNLTTTLDPEAKPLFKWDNPFGYTFNGGLAGKSQLTEMVEAKGGRTDGVFRFTHSWNELEPNQSLMDLHVFMPGNNHRADNTPHETYGSGRRVGWNRRIDESSGGKQDVDYTNQAPKGYVPVENITFPDLAKMPDGDYICKIHNWEYRNSGGRGKAEIAVGGQLYQYEYPATKNHQWITVATVTLRNGQFSIKHALPETTSSQNLWGLTTGEFHKVNLVSTTPNHWGDSKIGNNHYLFMLTGCKNPEPVRGFHNEHLNSELMGVRKVLDVLGDSAMIEPSDDQLAGVGFNETVRDEVIVRVSGSFKRVIKVTF